MRTAIYPDTFHTATSKLWNNKYCYYSCKLFSSLQLHFSAMSLKPCNTVYNKNCLGHICWCSLFASPLPHWMAKEHFSAGASLPSGFKVCGGSLSFWGWDIRFRIQRDWIKPCWLGAWQPLLWLLKAAMSSGIQNPFAHFSIALPLKLEVPVRKLPMASFQHPAAALLLWLC